MSPQSILRILEIVGTFVFAISGALVAIKKRNDVYGVFILAIVCAVGGGVMRDTMLGLTPPTAFRDATYVAVTLAGALTTWFFHPQVERLSTLIRVLDAIGLSLFSVIGTQIALQSESSWYAALIFGVLTGTGGGMIRDVLAGEVPYVLQKEIYAVASLLGAASYLALSSLVQLHPTPSMLLAMSLCAGLRLLAIFKNWHLPQIPPGLGRRKPPY